MRALAEIAMRGRAYAIGLSMVGALLPLLTWVSASIVSLVVLRRGAIDGGVVLLWTLLPLAVSIYFVAPEENLEVVNFSLSLHRNTLRL